MVKSIALNLIYSLINVITLYPISFIAEEMNDDFIPNNI